MTAGTRAVTGETLGAWLLKASPAGGAVARMAAAAYADVRTRCVRPGYRADLMAPGQPVLLWVSGSDPVHPAGIHAAGVVDGEVVPTDDGPAVRVRLAPVDPPVLRSDLLAHPSLRGLEVLRVPAGSNPSYLDREQWAVLRDEHPQLRSERHRLGWRP